MKIKYIFAALLSMIILFTSFPVLAAEVSGNDANNILMAVNYNDHFYTTFDLTKAANTVNVSIPDIDFEYVIQNSMYGDYFDLSIVLGQYNLLGSDDTQRNLFEFYIPVTLSVDLGSPYIIDSAQYWIMYGGQKYYAINNIVQIISNEHFPLFSIGVDISAQNIGQTDRWGSFESYTDNSGYVHTYPSIRYEYNTTGLSYLKFSMTGGNFTIYDKGHNDRYLINNIDYTLGILYQRVNQIELYFYDLLNKIDVKFQALFSKLDEDQDELINGFDSQTGNDAGSNFDSSAADLGAAEDSLFEAASYDNIDYSEFEGFFSLSGVSSALSLLKTLMESLYNHLGIFGVPITIGLILLVITRILGYQNFTAGGG